MTRVFFTKDYWHDRSQSVSVFYPAGKEFDVDDDIAETAVLKGCAQIAAFAAYELSEPVEIDDNFYDEDEAE